MEAALNQSKKYETVEYPIQKVDNLEQKRQESQAVFETLALQNREKYYEAYDDFVQKAKTLGFDRIEDYDIFFEFNKNSDTNMAVFNYFTSGENYITIKDKTVEDEDKIGIIKTLFHELVGHCLLSKNVTKISPRLNNFNSGLSFDKRRKDLRYDINFDSLQNINEFLKDETGTVKLNDDSRSLLVNYSRSKNFKDYFEMGEELVGKYLNNVKFKGSSLPIGVETKKFGVELNEGVTEFLAIYMSASDE
ncbi:MAG: hypothetical protein H7196_01830 [candidate division SR1 bacterium]|nr:hypothetical protein [candidate division SR1 bacterium]